MTYKVHNQLMYTAKLPYSKIKGSFKQRTEYGEKLFDKFYRNLSPTIQNNTCSIKDLYRSLNLTFKPEKIKTKIECLEKDRDSKRLASIGAITKTSVDKDVKNIKYQGFFFRFPINKENKKITQISYVFHEVQHLIDNLVHPKFLIRNQNIFAKQNKYGIDDLLAHIFLQDVNSPHHANMNHIDAVTDIALNSLDNITAINFLQDMRYALQSEIFAYNAEIKYLTKTNQTTKAKELQDFIDNDYILKQKLEYVNKKIKDIAFNWRKQHKETIMLQKAHKD